MIQRQGMVGILMLLYLVYPMANAETVRVAVASNFIETARVLAKEFSQQNDTKVLLSPGSSGKLYAQIIHGAPFELFLSADQDKPAALVEKNLALRQYQSTYAIGRLVLVVNQHQLVLNGLDTLRSPKLERLALANPKLAPYGFAAHAVLQKLGLIEHTNSRWVMGENISQTLQFLVTGNVQAALVAGSQLAKLQGDQRFSYFDIPSQMYPEIKQDMVLLSSALANSDAVAFWRFLNGDVARVTIQQHGYNLAEHALPEQTIIGGH